MFTYHCLNNISEKGLEKFNASFVPVDTIDADAILVRSANMKEMDIPEKVKAIARAGAGVNNIPLKECAEKGIVVMNTPGANANGVKELVIAGMLLASRDIIGGIEWVEENEDDSDIAKRAEKEKKKFAGTEINGKKLGIIGLGAIGVLVANAAVALGMDVYGYDPYISVNAAWNVSRAIHHVNDLNKIFSECDYITLHVPANEETTGMINEKAISQMKEGVVILNFARDLLVDEEALISGLDSGKIRKYVTDFATPAIAKADNTLITPHLGASTEESEENCAKMAVRQIRDFLDNGNITNSVNYPDCSLGNSNNVGRVTICHKNEPNMIAQFSKAFGEVGINIADITSKSKGEFAYCIIDVASTPKQDIIDKLNGIEGVLRVRVI